MAESRKSKQRYYRCPDCGGWHRHQGDESIPPCSDATKQRAGDYIEHLLAKAFGHGARHAILERAAERLNTWAECSAWGAAVREPYASNDHILSGYIKADLEKWKRLRADLENGSGCTTAKYRATAIIRN